MGISNEDTVGYCRHIHVGTFWSYAWAQAHCLSITLTHAKHGKL